MIEKLMVPTTSHSVSVDDF